MLGILNNEVQIFRDGIKQRNPQKLHNLDITKKECFETAVWLAYNDAKRTLEGIGSSGVDIDELQKEIAKELNAYFDGNPAKSVKDFDNKHDAICQIWCKAFSKSSKPYLGTYGRAQKIVNMAFKYLYCCENADKKKGHFDFCHMPLDSFTLEWFKRTMPKGLRLNLIPGKICSWSKLENENGDTFMDSKGKEYYTYNYYVKNIREYIQNNSLQLSPLELEFIEWPKIQKEIAAENFLFSLQPVGNGSTRAKIREMSLKKKYEMIKKQLP